MGMMHMTALPTFQGAMLCHAAEGPAQVGVPLYLPCAGGIALGVQERRLAGAPQLHGCCRPLIGSHRCHREPVFCQLNGRLQNLQYESEAPFSYASQRCSAELE